MNTTKPTDWLKGHPKTLYDFNLCRGLHLVICCGQHQSGKISIHQSISLHFGLFSLSTFEIKPNKNAASLHTMDKLNEILNHYEWLEA